MRRLVILAMAALILGGCTETAPSDAPTPTQTPTATLTPEPTPTPEPTASPEPTPAPTPWTFSALTSRAWALLVKSPDDYTGKGYKLWGCISQFDSATGSTNFRAQTSYRRETYWYSEGENAMFMGNEDKLAPFVTDDVVFMDVLVIGSYTYDTTIGGTSTVPMFNVMNITRKGSCA